MPHGNMYIQYTHIYIYCRYLYTQPASLNISLLIQIFCLSVSLTHTCRHTCFQTVHTNPHTAATLLFPACGYSQTESEWHHKPVCPFHAKPDVSLSHMPLRRTAYSSHSSVTARTSLPPSVITYKSNWQLEAQLARSGSHSNQSVPYALNNLPLPPRWVFLHTFIIHHHGSFLCLFFFSSFLCLWTAPSVISASIALPLQCIWQHSPGDTQNNKTDRYWQYSCIARAQPRVQLWECVE